MAENFDVTDLVKLGVEDERSGVAWYETLAGKAKNPEIRKVFAELADVERFHQKRFEDMLSDLGGVRTREEYPGQFMEYLQALAGARAFQDPETARKLANGIGSDAEALDISSQYERDTLVLMHEMRQYIPEKDRATVDELTREEQGHLVTLASARRNLPAEG